MTQLQILDTRQAISGDRKPEQVMLASKGPVTRARYLTALNETSKCFDTTVDQFPWENITFQHLEAIKTMLLEGVMDGDTYKVDPKSPRTVEGYISAIKEVCKVSRKLGYIDHDQLDYLLEVKVPSFERPLAGRVLNIAEIDKLLKACVKDGSDLAIRDGAIIALMYLCGLRRFEIANMLYEDIGDNEILVKGKGDRQETVQIINGAIDWLNAYLNVRGVEPGPLFYHNRPRTSDLVPEPIYDKVVERAINKRASQAGVNDVHTHDFRRSLCTHLLELGIDIFTVAKISRHKNLDVLRRYDRRSDEEKRKALRKIHVFTP